MEINGDSRLHFPPPALAVSLRRRLDHLDLYLIFPGGFSHERLKKPFRQWTGGLVQDGAPI